MPELPEVEVTRRSFAQAIAGALVTAVRVGKPLRWPLGVEGNTLVGRRVSGVRRRGKYLLVDMDPGVLLVHLGMSGSLRFAHGLPPPGPHDHFDLVTTQGTLRLHDPRRFGAVVHAVGESDPVAQKLLGGLGMEPLTDDFTLEAFSRGIKASRVPIKQRLLAGTVVVGVGNIYASEVLFLSGIRPQTPSARIGPARMGKLHAAIRQVLERAVELGGSTLKDFSNADGAYGSYQAHANVYGRDGAPCKVCGTPIRMLRQGQRSSYFCPRCQRA